jgi:hypothetical protein
MKWGTRYTAEDVNKLYSMVKRNLTLPFRFACFTDDKKGIVQEVECFPLLTIYVPPKNDVSPWRKLTMFSKELGNLKGRALFLDLDIVIIDNIDCFFSYSQDDFCIIENWTQLGKGIGNSSVYLFTIGKYTDVLQKYNDNTEEVLKNHDNEQIFLSRNIKPIKFWPKEWCKSFKVHCLPGGILNWFLTPKIPQNAKIIVFHGNPKPSDAAVGKWPGSWRKHVRPTSWISKYWC